MKPPESWIVKLVMLSLITGLLAMLSLGVDYTVNPTISPAQPVTNQSINCSWKATEGSATYNANVTWYNGSAEYATENEIECNSGQVCYSPAGILGENIRRGEIWNCTVSIYNATGESTKSTSTNVSNADPSVTPLGNVTWLEDVPYSITMDAADPEGDSLIWISIDYNATPDLFTINQNTGQISFTPEEDDIGNHTIDIIALDGHQGSDTVRSRFEIVEVDDYPVFNPSLTDQTAIEETAFTYTITVNDEEEDDLNFTLNCSTLDNLTLEWVDATTATITFDYADQAPRLSDVGNHTVKVTVYQIDNNTINTSEEFNLEIQTINHAPELHFIPQHNGTQNQTYNFTLNITANDTEQASTLTFSIGTNCSYNNPWTITTSDSSANATGYINQRLNNTHVLCRWVTIHVSDGTLTDSQTVFLNITNTNDPPVIENISNYGVNNAGNNISDLEGHYGVELIYKVNVTDVDQLTYEGDTITYSTNDTLFPISATGIVQVDINSSLLGNHTVKVNATDQEGAWYATDMNIEIINNTIPELEQIAPMSCAEDTLCTRYIDAVDPDIGENLTFLSNDSMHFPITEHNATAALFNFTPDDTMVGNYSVKVNVTDQWGAKDEEVFVLQINNTNDAPFFDLDRDESVDELSFETIVESYRFMYLINVTDFDIQFGDVVTFNVTYLEGNSLFSITKLGDDTGMINYTPNSSSDGNYSVNITVEDLEGAIDWQVINFTVYNRSAPPNISRIIPYYNSTLGNTIQNWTLAENFGNHITSISAEENTTLYFNASAYDDDNSLGELTFYWYEDGSIQANTSGEENNGFNRSYSFTDSGTYNLTLKVQDPYYSYNYFTWDLRVDDVNRQPLLLNNLINLTGGLSINSTVVISDYFSFYNGAQRLLDPDDDLNGNNMIRDQGIDPGESFSLTINASSCAYATLTFTGGDLRVVPEDVGTCNVHFTATDSGGLSVTSNEVSIDVMEVPEGNSTTEPEVIEQTSGSSSTTSISSRIVLPVQQDVDVPKPVEIIVPGRVVIYENRTMRIPVLIRNNWNNTLTGIDLSAETNNSNVEMEFTNDYIAELPSGEERQEYLVLRNYREEGPYEIMVRADVTDPQFSDTGTIFINAIEQADIGSQVQTKINFAKDLLSSNQECQELNELLLKAERASRNADYDSAINIVDSVVNGCKYMIKQVNAVEEKPQSTTQLLYFRIRKDYLNYATAFFSLLILVFMIVLVTLKKKEIKALKELD